MAKVDLTKEDLMNIFALINAAPIKGMEAMTVAMLQQRIKSLIEIIDTKEDVKTDK